MQAGKHCRTLDNYKITSWNEFVFTDIYVTSKELWYNKKKKKWSSQSYLKKKEYIMKLL